MDLDGPAGLFSSLLDLVERVTLHVRLALAKYDAVAPLGRRYTLAYDATKEAYAIVPSLRALHTRGVVLAVREADALLVTLSRHRSDWGRDGYPDGFDERLGPFSYVRHDARRRCYTVIGVPFAGGTDPVELTEWEADRLIVTLGTHRRGGLTV